jgi:3-phenylpropionate/trans-cinnamate dioxygenase ferredoxin component
MSPNTKEFQFACKLSSLKPNQPQTVEIDDRFVIVVLLNDQVYCIEDLCTHDGGTFGSAELEGACIVCPRHGAKFDVRTGEAKCMPATEATLSHVVRVDGDNVLIQLSDDN